MKKAVLFLFLIISFHVFSQDGERGSLAKDISAAKSTVKRALIIGISNYNAEELKLNYAENDAALFRDS